MQNSPSHAAAMTKCGISLRASMMSRETPQRHWRIQGINGQVWAAGHADTTDMEHVHIRSMPREEKAGSDRWADIEF